MLNSWRAGPGRAQGGGAARGQCAPMHVLARHERRPGRVLDARCPAGVVLELDHGGARVE